MDVFHYIKKITTRALPMLLAFYCLLTPLTALAEEVRLEVLAQLPSLNSTNKITVIALPVNSDNKHQYLIADDAGELSLLNNAQLTFLARLPLNNHTADKPVKLTALTLHPSFSLADKSGFQSFFTAHIEPAKINNNVARLTLLADPVALPFDAVITQWQYNNTAAIKIDVQQRREVLRIAVPTVTHQIQKIAFNPYNKVWHDDYGLMHIALSDSNASLPNTSEAALYSGVVLRINPEKFGLRNYRVPSSNPFMKTNDVNNEIFILGAQNISSFSWSKKHYGALLVEHDYDGGHQVAVADKGADWRDSYQNNLVFPLKSTQGTNENILPYYGRNLKASVGSVLYLINDTKNWQLAQLNTTMVNSEAKSSAAALPILSFSRHELPPKNKVSLLFDHNGEPLLLDLTNKQLLSVKAIPLKSDNSSISVVNKSDEQSALLSNSAYGKLLLTLFILVIAVVFYRLRPKKVNQKAKLRRQLARFELDTSQTTVSFYKRHQSEIDSQLAVTDIVKSEIWVNDSNVSIINEDVDHGYNEQCENKLRLSFNQAHRHKLINDETRQVLLYLTDKNAKTHVVCLYFRKGNQRLTKAKYFDILESLIDWNWFIASQLNPQATTARPLKVTVVKSAIKKVFKKANAEPKSIDAPEIENPLPSKQTAPVLHDIVAHDSELISALDKLVDLKQQGFLTDEEFSLAKAKILSDMTI